MKLFTSAFFFFIFFIFQVATTQCKPVKLLGLLKCHGAKTEVFFTKNITHYVINKTKKIITIDTHLMIAVTMNMITKYKELNHSKIKDTVNAAEWISMTLKI